MTAPITPSAATALAAGGRSPAIAARGDGGLYTDFGAMAKLKTQSREDPKAAMHEVAKQFESLFVTMMMKAMRDTLPKDGLFNSSALDSYQSMFDQQLSLDLSRHGSLGLASVIERQLSQTIVPSTPADKGE